MKSYGLWMEVGIRSHLQCISNTLPTHLIPLRYVNALPSGLIQYWQKGKQSNCSNHQAVNQANAQRNQLTVTGISGCACAQHGCFVPHSMVDFQKGEQYASEYLSHSGSYPFIDRSTWIMPWCMPSGMAWIHGNMWLHFMTSIVSTTKTWPTSLKETILYLSLTVYKSSLALASGMYMVTRPHAFPGMLLVLFQELARSMGK